ncbi:hypothetical protein [Candidatus Uabimicrobium sp. HlEnr_7]|uniref:hypothetical protein n=1 Tax=Candidatus Uabimicrobium helgolandensis TaxID=3095367 RepID=UPI0035583D98
MDITEITLETITQIREQSRATGYVRYNKLIPKAPLKWLIDALNIDECVIEQLTKEGDYVVNSILRKNKKNKLVEDSKNSIKFDIKFPKSQWHNKLPFFKLDFLRKTPFTDHEKKGLDVIVRFLGDYVYERILSTNEYNVTNTLSQLENICSKVEKEPGTTIWRYFAKLHKSLSAYASFLLLVDENRYIIPYYKLPMRGSPVYQKDAEAKNLDSELLQFCRDESVFLWRAREEDSSVAQIMKEYLPENKQHWDCLVGVSKYDGAPLGIWIFAFQSDFPIFRPLYDQLLEGALTYPQNALQNVYAKRTSKMIVKPIFHSREYIVEPNKVFTLMPFTESWSTTVWQDYIRPTIEKCELKAVRADDLYGHDIMEDIWKGICSSRFVIAEITGRNSNVFYELGIAHTVGKQVILLTQNVADIPFDLNRYRHIIYENSVEGYQRLCINLQATIREITKNS